MHAKYGNKMGRNKTLTLVKIAQLNKAVEDLKHINFNQDNFR